MSWRRGMRHHSLMTPALAQAALTVNDAPADRPPRCSGVYRFFSESGQLLYVGKSIDMAARIASHFADGRRRGRQQRMMQAVAHIDCQPCAGEIGALLRENLAIKAETPLFNRRQRRVRKLWTVQLVPGGDGFARVEARDFCTWDRCDDAVFGLYHSREHIESTLRRLARDQALCLRVLGLDRGSGPCFQHQIKRCRGACAGKESAAAHNDRLRAVLEIERIAAWPFATAILLRERAPGALAEQPTSDWHVVNRWSYLGSYRDRRQAARAQRRSGPAELIFDRDAYRIILRALYAGSVDIFAADGSTALENPLLGAGTRACA